MTKNGKKVPMVTMYETAEAKKYKKEFIKYVKEEIIKQKWDINYTKDKHFYFDTIFHFDRVDKDEQNYYKCLCDALNGLAYIDDRNILTRCFKIDYDTVNPRIEIIIHPVDYIGIFNNENALNNFKDNYCHNNCNRFSRNCSILRNAIEGRVSEVSEYIDIQNMKCNAFKQKKSK